ncbi:MAG: hypothetical protein AMXMBFR74_05230 [Parvibaculum sp.]|uniref:hypothetical protein n=1 Tax=Parvibaculum sp. TaxID=2024848 RepID=UPI0035BAE860
MNGYKDYFAALKAALGFRRFLLTSIVSSATALVDRISKKSVEFGLDYLVAIPSWLIGACVFSALIFWWVLSYAVTLRRQILGTRVALSHLRGEGVKLRNAATSVFPTQRDFDEWEKKVLDWRTLVIEEIRKINEADAEWFSVLDVVPPPRISISSLTPTQTAATMNWAAAQKKLYGEHDCRLARLGDMIQNLWRDGTVPQH